MPEDNWKASNHGVHLHLVIAYAHAWDSVLSTLMNSKTDQQAWQNVALLFLLHDMDGGCDRGCG